uniref:Uncharacterized protein n=1 Tax=Anguilla anguilla TaxID=7936 RepID=A0A0E9UGM8_ANGAN
MKQWIRATPRRRLHV